MLKNASAKSRVLGVVVLLKWLFKCIFFRQYFRFSWYLTLLKVQHDKYDLWRIQIRTSASALEPNMWVPITHPEIRLCPTVWPNIWPLTTMKISPRLLKLAKVHFCQFHLFYLKTFCQNQESNRMNFTDYLPMLYDIIGYFKNVPEHINLQSTVATNMFANWSNALILMSFSL